MRNTSGLSSKEFEEIKVEITSSEEIENKLIEEHLGQVNIGWDEDKEKAMIKSLMHIMSSEKKEGEKVYEFEARIKEEIKNLLNLA
jgi:hypothetical protein